MENDNTLIIEIEDLTEEEALKMTESIKEIAQKYGVKIEDIHFGTKE